MTDANTLPAWATHWTRAALADLPADITTATPPQVDEVIRTVQLERMTAGDRLERAYSDLFRALGYTHHSERVGGARSNERREWWTNRNGAEIHPPTEVEAARKLPADTRSVAYSGPATIGEAFAAVDEIRAHRADMARVIKTGDDEWRRRGMWTRFHLVDNSNGHVHTSTSCKECYATTRFTWPTALSGGTPETVVEAAGERTCLTCFPEVRGTILEHQPPRLEAFDTPEGRAERERLAAERKAKLDEKIAKGVTPDGKPLHVRVGGLGADIKTERAAELRYLEWATRVAQLERRAKARPDLEFAGEIADYQAGADEMTKALAWKRNRTVEQIVASLAGKLEAKITRETY